MGLAGAPAGPTPLCGGWSPQGGAVTFPRWRGGGAHLELAPFWCCCPPIAWCDLRARSHLCCWPRALRAWGLGVGVPALTLPSAVEPGLSSQVPAGPGLPIRTRDCGWPQTGLSVAADHKVIRGDGLWERGPALGSVVPCMATPGPAGGQNMTVSWQPPERTPLGAWEMAGFTFGRAGRHPGRGGSRSTGVWGRHAEGPAWAKAEPGLQEAKDRVDRGMPHPRSTSSLSLPPWGGACCGQCAQHRLSGKGWGLRAGPQPWLWEDAVSWGPWRLWTAVSLQCAGAGAGRSGYGRRP